MIIVNDFCNEFMILVVMVCIALLSTKLSLIIFNFPLFF